VNFNKGILWPIPLLAVTGCSTFNSNPQEIEYTVIEKPAYQRGSYFKTNRGYYISNLTPAPVQAEGCDTPILTADLSAPRSDSDDIYITEVEVECDGS